MKHFIKYNNDALKEFVKIRPNETKLGEMIHVGNFEGNFILFGIPESIGVKANHGIGGTESLWGDFLRSFLNIQSTNQLVGHEISVLGHFSFDNQSVEKIDEEVEELVSLIISHNKIPIAIGGGHNNSYPIIKAISKHLSNPINVINLDAHTDFRIKEKRHSGNGFRYAYDEGFLKKYAVIGLDENYNSQLIISELENNQDIHLAFYEDICIREKITFIEAISSALSHTKTSNLGIEIDLDAIENVLSSAVSPIGFSALQARQFLYRVSKESKILYLHIAEGATKLENGFSNPLTAKLVSYLVSDFCKVV